MYERLTAVLNRENCEVLSASTEAYAFIGRRYYHSFDQLVCPDDLATFREGLAVCDEKPLALRLMREDGEKALFIASFRPSEHPFAAVVTLLLAEGIGKMLDGLQNRIERKNYILSIYCDEYFEYNAKTDLIRIYRIDKYEQTIVEAPLNTFFERMRRFALPSGRGDVEQFIRDFTGHQATFALRAEGHLLDGKKDAVITLVKGVSFFEGGVYKGAAGILHFGKRRNASASVVSERDSLTGLISKAEITRAAINQIDVLHASNTTIAIVDVDYFKSVNDSFGHMVGDSVLKRVSSILVDEVGEKGLVGRIGGDEFMIVYFGVENMENNRELMRAIKNRVAAIYPPDTPDTPTVTLSIGCASYPKDADKYENLFRLADFAMYRAKHNGRNRYVIYDEKKHGSLTEVLTRVAVPARMNNRGDMSPSDIICTLMSRVFSGERDPIETLLEDAALNLGVQRIMLYAGDPWKVVCMAGEQRPSPDVLRRTIGYLDAPELRKMYDAQGVMVLDDVERIRAMNYGFYDQMKSQSLLSCVHIRGTDAANQRFLLSFESVSNRVTWNPQLVRYYTLFQRILHEYVL